MTKMNDVLLFEILDLHHRILESSPELPDTFDYRPY